MMNTSKPANASKWMRMALLAALAAIVAAGCNNDEIEAVSNTPANKSGKMTIHVATGERTAETRVAYDDNKVGTADGKALTWQAGDQLTVVRMDYDRYRNHKSDYLYQGKDGDTSGNFEGTEITDWGNSWTVYYPHTVEIDTKDGTATLPMTGQIQAADGSTAHLRNYMLLAATDLTNLDDGFSLEMKSSIMKFDLEDVPTQVGKLTSLMWMMETDTGSKCITLGFAQGAVDFGPRGSNSDGKLTAYIAFMPEEMSMKQPDAVITLMLIGEKTYTAVTTITLGKKYEAGKRYTINTNNKTMTWMPFPIMALTVKVEEGNLDFSIPFPTSGSTPVGVTVHWGDGSKNFVYEGISLSERDGFNHTYAAPGTYTISIMSDQPDETPQLIQMPEFNFGNYRTANSNAAKLISIDTPLLTMPTTDLSLCFQNCTALQNIPLGLFDKNIEAANFNRCFSNCHALRSIPEGLFDKNTKATDFERCFYNCSRLALNEKIFSTDQPPYNRFAGKGMDFTDCFANINPESSVAGTAPDLWNYEKGDVAWNTANCFGGADKLSNWNQIHSDWGGPNVDKATMKLTVTVKGDNLGFNIPFPTSGTTPAGITVDWGDGDKVTVESGKTLSANDDFSHVYSKAGTYTITIISEQMEVTKQQIPDFNFGLNRVRNSNAVKLISVDTPLLKTGATSFRDCFDGCETLQSIPEGLFDKNTQIKSFNFCFGRCIVLQSIPQGLFDKNTEATVFSSCFSSCRALKSIPQGLFDKNIKTESFASCFSDCTALQSIPQGLFEKNTKAEEFSKTFANCKNLTLNKKIFSRDDSPYKLFAGKRMVFSQCFKNVGTELTSAGTTPDLWNYDMGGKAWYITDCFANTNNLSNWNDIPTEWGGPKADKVIMKLTVEVERGNLSFNIPFPTTGTVPAKITVDWGDDNGYVAERGKALSANDGFNHIYSMAGKYIITITSDQTSEAQQQIPDFNFGKNRNKNANASKLISVNTPLLNTGATDFSKCFYDCQALESIPEGLFAKQTKAEDFNSCFYNCSKLTLNSKIFSTSNSPYGLFTGRSMDFGFCFYNTGSAVASSASGIAPDLWNYEMGNKAWVTNNCFTSSNKLNNWNDIPADWGGPKKVEKVSMKLTVTVEENSGLGFSIPFPVIGTTPAKMTVDWGDGKKSEVASGTNLSESDDFNHMYSTAGTYTITITSTQIEATRKQIPDLNFGKNRNDNSNSSKLISIDTPLLNTEATEFTLCFYKCTALKTIPKGLFDKNTEITDFRSCFDQCEALQSIPKGLFDTHTRVTTFGGCFNACKSLQSIPDELFYMNTKVTSFEGCFSNCSALQNIPKGLFDKNTRAMNFYFCFAGCTTLKNIPEGLFDENMEATNFERCFAFCSKLVLNTKIFNLDESPYNRFAGKEMNFDRCFYKVGTDLTSGAAGTAPDLWNYSMDGKAWYTSRCFTDSNNLSNWDDIPTGWGGPKQ